MKSSRKEDRHQPASTEQGAAGTYHTPVLLKEVIQLLQINPDGVYVDCTFGGGGHSREILKKLSPQGKLIAFDQDMDARMNLPEDAKLLFVPSNFRYIQRFLRLHDIKEVDGVIADLGVSSFQFDEASRGFSIRFDAPLDMRMDQRQSRTAADILQQLPEAALHKLFEQYGEVTNARTLARTIAEWRVKAGLRTIEELKTAVRPIVKGNPNKYLAQVFQALRMEVNDEMGALKELLQQLPEVLKTGGRAAVITFHSIEDRLVKIFFRDNTFDAPDENPFATTEKRTVLKLVNKKPIVATNEEIKNNPRARSAKLRVAEKI